MWVGVVCQFLIRAKEWVGVCGRFLIWACVHPPQGVESGGEETTVTSELKDLEFKLLHDLSRLQVGLLKVSLQMEDTFEGCKCSLSYFANVCMLDLQRTTSL